MENLPEYSVSEPQFEHKPSQLWSRSATH